MKNENRQYLIRIEEELDKYYNGFEDEEGEQKGLYDYISEEVLDFEITINSRFEYQGVKLYITLGGPTVWIDTNHREINIVWGTDHDSLWIDSCVCNEIDEYFEELYNCR